MKAIAIFIFMISLNAFGDTYSSENENLKLYACSTIIRKHEYLDARSFYTKYYMAESAKDAFLAAQGSRSLREVKHEIWSFSYIPTNVLTNYNGPILKNNMDRKSALVCTLNKSNVKIY